MALYPAPTATALGIGKAAIRHLAFCLAGELGPSEIHVATVTIAGYVQPGTHFAPDRIADVYWQLYSQPQESWDTEVVYG